MRVVDVGSGRVVDQACQDAFHSSISTASALSASINVKKRSVLAISSSSENHTSQIVVPPPPPPSSKQRRVTSPDDFTVSAPISRDRVRSRHGVGSTPTYVPPTRPYQPHHTASMLAPSVIVDSSSPSRNAVTVPPMNRYPSQPSASMPMPMPSMPMMPMSTAAPMSPLMAEANRIVGKVPLVFFFIIGTLVGMLGAMAVVTAFNEAGAAQSPRKATTTSSDISQSQQQHQPVSIRANRLFVYPLMMTTERASSSGEGGGMNVHGRTASSRLSANAGR